MNWKDIDRIIIVFRQQSPATMKLNFFRIFLSSNVWVVWLKLGKCKYWCIECDELNTIWVVRINMVTMHEQSIFSSVCAVQMFDACIQTTRLYLKKKCNILLNEHCKFMWFTHWFNHSRNNSLRLPHFHSHFIVFTFIFVFFSFFLFIFNFKLWQCSAINDQGNQTNYNSHIWLN